MTILDDYSAFDGRHWETGSVHNHWAYRRFEAPHTGQPYSEALLMGVSGGVVTGYFTFSYEGHDPHVALLTRNTFDPLEALLTRLGVVQHIEHTTSAAKARDNLLAALDAGLPPLVWADVWGLPYNALDAEADGMWRMAPVVVFGVTDEAVHIADRSSQPLHAAPEVFHAARAKVKKDKFRVMTLDAPQKIETAVQMGIFDALKIALEGPPRGSAKNFGVRGLAKWREELLKGKWQKTFLPGRAYLNGLLTAYEGIRPDGERGLYAAFLDEAAVILERPALRDAAEAFRAAVPAWAALGEALLPGEIPALADLRTQTDTAHRLFIEEGQAALEAVRKAKARIEAIKGGEFPLDAGAVADHMEGVAAALDELIAAEEAAFEALQHAMA